MNPFKVGDEVHGFAHGAFGRDSYKCRVVEAIGHDWALTRNATDEVELVSGAALNLAYVWRDERSYCDDECDAKP